MNQNPGIEAVQSLTNMGYRFTVNGETIKAKYRGPGKPDPETVWPLFDLLKAHKNEVLSFLRGYCPKCGGSCFGTFADGHQRCLANYWEGLKASNPGLELRH
jgi:hypothetical protein